MTFADSPFFRRRFKFETEYGQHRNWWVRDPRITGNPLSVYLYLLSHDPDRMPTQTAARSDLRLGQKAWKAAKESLLRAGFMLEVRDRYPAGYVDSQGQHKGGQKRFRLELLDPEPGLEYELEDVVLVLDCPLESIEGTPAQNQYAKSIVDAPDQYAKSIVDEKPPVSSSMPLATWREATMPKGGVLIGREKGLVRLGSNTQPTTTEPTDAGAREAEVDARLAALLPEVSPPLTVASIAREVDGRLNLAGIDLVQAVLDTVLRQRSAVENPAAYVASVLVRKPTAWRIDTLPAVPGAYLPPTGGLEAPQHGFEPVSEQARRADRKAACARGDHDWGSSSWAEVDRAYCLHCGVSRRTLDPVFRELQDEHDKFLLGGDL